MLDTDEMNEEGSDNDLPVGRKPINAVLLACLAIALWAAAANLGLLGA